MPIIRVKHIDDNDILNNELIINPVSILGDKVNEMNILLSKEAKSAYKYVKETTAVNRVRGKHQKREILDGLRIRPIMPTSFNILVWYKPRLRFIINIPYYRKKDEREYLDTLRKMFNEAREYRGVAISIPLYGKCFGKLKKEVVKIVIESDYPAYVDLYVDDKSKELVSNMLAENKNGVGQKPTKSGV